MVTRDSIHISGVWEKWKTIIYETVVEEYGKSGVHRGGCGEGGGYGGAVGKYGSGGEKGSTGDGSSNQHTCT